jgi:hypothetical protein
MTYRNTGRPYFPTRIFESVVERAEETGQTIREICAKDRSLPAASTVYPRIYEDEQLAARYAAAMRNRKLTEGTA